MHANIYVNGELPQDADESERSIQKLLRYIGESIDKNVTDENTRRLDGIVREMKAQKDLGAKYMKSWEREKELREEGREEERANTERERKRADAAEQRVNEMSNELQEMKARLAELEKEKNNA